ncbi:MAG: D-alanyl-D-alanine carboxypeptidase [Clostridia bacterium]|nr:D-alanyl-D-alanine carboxypeptidase [Clostridia bacterium]
MFKNWKLLKIFLLTLMLIYSLTPCILADDNNEILDDNSTINSQIVETLETSSPETNLPDINSRAAVVIDRATNTILYGKKETEHRKMASTTKIMTCLLVIENCDLSETIEVSKKSAGTGGSRLGLKTGDKITINDLLYGLMLCSGNDTAVALAEHIGGSIEGFAEIMNNRAKELGLENTHFVTPHGLDADEHYTTAYELAKLTNYALNNEIFAKIVGTKTYSVTINGYPKTISNTNELLGNLNGVYGVKTGFTNGANRCLVTACKRNNLDIICVVLGADTKKFRTQDSIKLIEYSFKTFTPVNVQELVNKKFEEWKHENINCFEIIKGQTQNVELKINPLEYSTLPINNNSIKDLNILINCKQILNAPVLKDSYLGKIEVYSGEEVLTSCDILLNCNILKKNMFDYFIEILCSYRNQIN